MEEGIRYLRCIKYIFDQFLLHSECQETWYSLCPFKFTYYTTVATNWKASLQDRLRFLNFKSLCKDYKFLEETLFCQLNIKWMYYYALYFICYLPAVLSHSDSRQPSSLKKFIFFLNGKSIIPIYKHDLCMKLQLELERVCSPAPSPIKRNL